jgi:hypothetical protein
MTFLTVKTRRKSAPLLALGLPRLHMGLVGLTTFRLIDNCVPLEASYPRPCYERRNGDETAPLPDGLTFLVHGASQSCGSLAATCAVLM